MEDMDGRVSDNLCLLLKLIKFYLQTEIDLNCTFSNNDFIAKFNFT